MNNNFYDNFYPDWLEGEVISLKKEISDRGSVSYLVSLKTNDDMVISTYLYTKSFREYEEENNLFAELRPGTRLALHGNNVKTDNIEFSNIISNWEVYLPTEKFLRSINFY